MKTVGGNGVLPRLRPRAFLAQSLRRPSDEDGRLELLSARFSERFRGVSGHPFETGFDLTLRPERLLQPFAWKRSRMIFVNSMSDLFHKGIPRAHIAAVFETMEKADWHVYQVLTKRSSLLQKFINDRYKEIG